MSYYMMNFY